jgi:uncharacterized protein (UPF0335 family)
MQSKNRQMHEKLVALAHAVAIRDEVERFVREIESGEPERQERAIDELELPVWREMQKWGFDADWIKEQLAGRD